MPGVVVCLGRFVVLVVFVVVTLGVVVMAETVFVVVEATVVGADFVVPAVGASDDGGMVRTPSKINGVVVVDAGGEYTPSRVGGCVKIALDVVGASVASARVVVLVGSGGWKW